MTDYRGVYTNESTDLMADILKVFEVHDDGTVKVLVALFNKRNNITYSIDNIVLPVTFFKWNKKV